MEIKNKKTFKKKKYLKRKKEKLNKNNTKIISETETLFNKAKQLYFSFSKEFDLDIIDISNYKNKDKKWTKEILETGTFDDKISSLILYIQKNPKETLKYLELLIKLVENKKKRDNFLIAIKDLFINYLLNNKKHLSFINKCHQNEEYSNEELIEFYYEDRIHCLYNKLINMIEDNLLKENIIEIKKRNLDILKDMLINQPEGEERILSILINKLGDPNVEVINYTIKLLKEIQEKHNKMSLVLFNNVKTFYINTKLENAKYFSLVFMSQMNIPINFPTFLENNITFFFDLFNKYSSIHEQENTYELEKILSLIVKRINYLLKYVKNNKSKMNKINGLIEEKINILFKLSHNKNLKLSIQILNLLLTLSETQDDNFKDRYYKTLYEFIPNINLSICKNIKDFLKILLISLMKDDKINRISSFIKRILQMSLSSEPNYIICNLIIVSQILRNKSKLWKLIIKDQKYNDTDFYDIHKRDPKFSGAEYSFINELNLLSNHYHPSVSRMSKFILDNFNKDIINYQGDPLIDFSLINFLDKFVLKNPKIQKIKKIKKNLTKEEQEDEEFKKFINDDNIPNDNSNDIPNNIQETKDDFMFIKKFNNVFPLLSQDKNFLKKKKLREQKNEEPDEDFEKDIDDKDLNDYADKVVMDEYKKLNKNYDDEDVSLDEDIIGEDEDDVIGEDDEDIIEDDENEELEE